MKHARIAVLFLTLFAGLTVAASADAHGRHRGGRVGIFIGAPVLAYSYYAWPRYYYPAPVYYAPPAYYPPAPPTYIEQSPPAAAPAPAPAQSSNTWYFCRESQTYYPYVQTCPSPWQPVTPNS